MDGTPERSYIPCNALISSFRLITDCNRPSRSAEGHQFTQKCGAGYIWCVYPRCQRVWTEILPSKRYLASTRRTVRRLRKGGEPRWRERGVTRSTSVRARRGNGAGCTAGAWVDHGQTDCSRVGRLRPDRRSVWQTLCRPHDSARLTEVGRRVRTRVQRGHLVT